MIGKDTTDYHEIKGEEKTNVMWLTNLLGIAGTTTNSAQDFTTDKLQPYNCYTQFMKKIAKTSKIKPPFFLTNLRPSRNLKFQRFLAVP
jgi:hypothetical protein